MQNWQNHVLTAHAIIYIKNGTLLPAFQRRNAKKYYTKDGKGGAAPKPKASASKKPRRVTKKNKDRKWAVAIFSRD